MMQQWWGEGGLDRTLLPWQLCCSSPHATIDCSRMAYLEKHCFLCCTVNNENSVQTIQTTHLNIHSSTRNSTCSIFMNHLMPFLGSPGFIF